MVLEAAQQVREGLAELIRLVNSGGASTTDARRVLSESKSFAAQVTVLQADAAALVAAGERHGDGGAGVLAQAAGLARRDAAVQVKTVEQLQSMPGLRDAVTDGEIPMANARTLAQASEKTSADQVRQDGELLEKAASLSPDQFVREANRWAVQRQDDGGEGAYRRQRARRRLSIWTDDGDGMMHLRGELDPVAGAKLHKRLLKEAERLRRCDLNSPGGEKRSLSQRLADALDTLTSTGSDEGSGSASSADVAIVQHLNPEGDKAFAEVAGGGVIPPSVPRGALLQRQDRRDRLQQQGRPVVARPRAAAANQGSDGRADRPLRRLFPLCCSPRAVPDPPHQAGLARRVHPDRQHGPGLLGLPSEDPPPQVADSHDQRCSYSAPARPGSLRTRPRPGGLRLAPARHR